MVNLTVVEFEPEIGLSFRGRKVKNIKPNRERKFFNLFLLS